MLSTTKRSSRGFCSSHKSTVTKMDLETRHRNRGLNEMTPGERVGRAVRAKRRCSAAVSWLRLQGREQVGPRQARSDPQAADLG